MRTAVISVRMSVVSTADAGSGVGWIWGDRVASPAGEAVRPATLRPLVAAEALGVLESDGREMPLLGFSALPWSRGATSRTQPTVDCQDVALTKRPRTRLTTVHCHASLARVKVCLWIPVVAGEVRPVYDPISVRAGAADTVSRTVEATASGRVRDPMTGADLVRTGAYVWRQPCTERREEVVPHRDHSVTGRPSLVERLTTPTGGVGR